MSGVRDNVELAKAYGQISEDTYKTLEAYANSKKGDASDLAAMDELDTAIRNGTVDLWGSGDGRRRTM